MHEGAGHTHTEALTYSERALDISYVLGYRILVIGHKRITRPGVGLKPPPRTLRPPASAGSQERAVSCWLDHTTLFTAVLLASFPTSRMRLVDLSVRVSHGINVRRP